MLVTTMPLGRLPRPCSKASHQVATASGGKLVANPSINPDAIDKAACTGYVTAPWSPITFALLDHLRNRETLACPKRD